MKPIIAIDVDEVLCDTLPCLIQFFNKNLNANVQISNFTTYLWHKVYGIPKQEMTNLYAQAIKEHIMDKSPLVIGAQQAIQQLATFGKLVAVTSRPSFMQEQTTNWIHAHFPKHFDDIVLCGQTVESAFVNDLKTQTLRNIGATHFIDDQTRFLANAPCQGLLLNKLWNANDALPAHVCRVRSWDEIVQLLLKNE